MILLVIIFYILISAVGYSQGYVNEEKKLKVDFCIQEIKKQNECLNNLTLIEFQNLNSKEKQYEEYLKIYTSLKQDFAKYQSLDPKQLEEEEQKKYLYILKPLTVCCAKLASTASILNAYSFAKQAKEYGEYYLSIQQDAGIHLTLSFLYSAVPSSPFGFGDEKKAEEHYRQYRQGCENNKESCVGVTESIKHIESLKHANATKEEIEESKKNVIKKEPKNCVEVLKKEIFIAKNQ